MATYTNSKIQQRIDTHTRWNTNNPTLSNGEIAFSSDKSDFKVGNGSAWRNTSYMIENNETVQTLATNVSNASAAATLAQTTANNAVQIANTALTSAGRKTDTTIISTHIDFSLLIDNLFISKYTNTDVLSTATEDNFTLTFGNFDFKPEYANEIKFIFMTKTACSVKSSGRFTTLPTDVDTNHDLLLTLEGNAAIYSAGTVNLAATAYVEITLSNSWHVNVKAISLV